MRLLIKACAVPLVTALVWQATPVPAQAASTAPAAAMPTAGSAADKNLTAWVTQVVADPDKFDQFLEEDCVEHGGPECDLTAQQINRIPGEVKTLTLALDQEVVDDPGLVAKSAGPQSRAVGSGLGKAIRNIASKSTNKLVQKLKDKADDIGEWTDRIGYTTNAAEGLAEKTAVAVSKAVVYSMPVFGDVFSLGESIANGDIEGGIVATVSLAATAIAVAFPPAGAVIAVGLAIYSVGKAIWGWLTGGGSDEEWTRNPPPTPQELLDKGANLEWVTHNVGGQNYVLEIPKEGEQVSQTLLLDSRWTEYNKSTQPVNYSLKPIGENVLGPYDSSVSPLTAWGVYAAKFQIWQGGRAIPGKCLRATHITYSDLAQALFDCGPDRTMTIGLNKPAVIKISYDYSLNCMTSRFPICEPPISVDKISANLNVYTTVANGDGDKTRLPVPYSYIITG